MPLADTNLVDGDSANVLQRGIGETSPEIILFDFLDHVPANAEQVGDILDRHAASQLQCVFGPVFGVGSTFSGKADFDLANDLAVVTLHARQGGDNDSPLESDRRSSEFALFGASSDHVLATAR